MLLDGKSLATCSPSAPRLWLRRVRVVALVGLAALVWLAPSASAPKPPSKAAGASAPLPTRGAVRAAVEAQRRRLLDEMRERLGLREDQVQAVRRIFNESPILGQGNPLISEHPVSLEACRAESLRAPPHPSAPECGSPYMALLYDPSTQTRAEAAACIDQFEFPGIPCEFPVVHVRADEAQRLCEAVGKRLCDAHEWEGACAGAVREPDEEYAWGQARAVMREVHNRGRSVTWAYGNQEAQRVCATTSRKSAGCPGGGFARCGSNTFPAGAFPQCVSSLGVYDLHGNVAEHMNLPLLPEQLRSRGGFGQTEMKGSWFIFARYRAHPDDCRWRAPNWHGSALMDPRSHSNYHLGFRCCKNIP